MNSGSGSQMLSSWERPIADFLCFCYLQVLKEVETVMRLVNSVF